MPLDRNDQGLLPMLTPRRTILVLRLLFIFATTGMLVLMLGPYQGLERSFGLNDKAAHVIAFYAFTAGLFVVAPSQRKGDLALIAIATALIVELLQSFTDRSVSIADFLAGVAGVAAAWLPGRVERLRHLARRYPDLTYAEIALRDRRRRARAAMVGSDEHDHTRFAKR